MSLPRRQTPHVTRVWSYQRPSGVLLLIAVLGGWASAQGLMWLLEITALREGLVLDAIGLRAHEYWRYATAQLIHASPLHFAGTALLLYFSGREVEPIVGRRHVLCLFLIANLLGGFASLALQPTASLYGASAAAAALLAAHATIVPEFDYRIRLCWLIPVRFRTWHLLLIGSAAAAWGLWAHRGIEIGLPGLFVGVLLGWTWARLLGFGRMFWFQRAALERHAVELRRERMTADEFISAEVDPILEKIAQHGLRSLSRAERKLLDRAKDKIETKSV